jgi:hypothetical protein
MFSQFDADIAERSIIEVRCLIERQQDLAARLVAAGLNAADVQATLKALTAQLELLEQELSKAARSA